MNDSLEELAGLYVLDQLDASARTAFEARLLREPELAALVRDLETGLVHGVRSLPQTQPPADLLARIESQIDGTEEARPASSAQASLTWLSFARWGIAAVIAVSLGILAVQSLRRSSAQPMIVVVGLDANRNTFTELPLSGATKDPDARFIQLASLAENFWQKPGELPVNARNTGEGNRGYALFDPASQQGFIAIEELAAITASQRYHLWVVDPTTGRIHDAGILPLSGMSRGLYSFTLAPGDAPKSTHPEFFITIEASNSPAQSPVPRGQVVLGKQRI